MSTTPAISVIMSVYNGEQYLREAVESVMNQTFKSWELIVINDCSNDSTAEILKELSDKDERVKVHTNEVNLRLPSSLNKALSLCTGKYIARMDADDICLCDRFEKQYKFMEENSDVMLSSCRFLTLKNGVYSSGGGGSRVDNEALRAMLLVTNPILHPGVIAKAEVIKGLCYDPNCTCTEDLNLWTRFANSDLKMQILDEYLLIYRLHDKQITSTTLERQSGEVLRIHEEYFAKHIAPMGEMAQYYIDGIYFKRVWDAEKFCSFFKWVKSENKKTKAFGKKELEYAFFEVLAEHRRHGISKKDLIKVLMNFSPMFLVKEITRRKKCAYNDGALCIEAAARTGLKKSSGTDLFPIFSK